MERRMSDDGLFRSGTAKPPPKPTAGRTPGGMKRPTKKMLDSFRPSMIDNMAVSLLIDRGWSLGICCRHCERLVEWTPDILAEKFAGKEGMGLRAIHGKLECGGDKGCGASDVAIFPYFPGQEQ